MKTIDLWLNNDVLAGCCTLLVDMDSARCDKDKSQKQVYFGDTFFYQRLMDLCNTSAQKKRGKYKYNSLVKQVCKKVPCGSLLDVHASYFPILVNEKHWVGAVILSESNEILIQHIE